MSDLQTWRQRIDRSAARSERAPRKDHVEFGLVRNEITRRKQRSLRIVIPRNVAMNRILVRRNRRIRAMRQDKRTFYADREAMPCRVLSPHDCRYGKWAESNDFQHGNATAARRRRETFDDRVR